MTGSNCRANFDDMVIYFLMNLMHCFVKPLPMLIQKRLKAPVLTTAAVLGSSLLSYGQEVGEASINTGDA